jgi:hypothetical protein
MSTAVSVPVDRGGLELTFLNDFVLLTPKPSILPADAVLEIGPSAKELVTDTTSDEKDAGDEDFVFIPTEVSLLHLTGVFPIIFLTDFIRVTSAFPVPASDILLLSSRKDDLSDTSSEELEADVALLNVLSMGSWPP